MIGRVPGGRKIEPLFQCLTDDGNLVAGPSQGQVPRDIPGLVEPHFDWSWLTGMAPAASPANSNFL